MVSMRSGDNFLSHAGRTSALSAFVARDTVLELDAGPMTRQSLEALPERRDGTLKQFLLLAGGAVNEIQPGFRSSTRAYSISSLAFTGVEMQLPNAGFP